MASSIPALTLSIVASAAVAQRRFVTATGARSGAGANALGVARYDAAAGENVAVDALGTTEVEAGGAIAAGALVQSDANGKAVTKAAGVAVGRAMGAAAGDGSVIELFLLPN